MRLRLNLLVLAVSSLILVSFLLPLALLLRTFAADRAVSAATSKAQWLAPLAATLSTRDLTLLVARVNAENPGEPTSVFLPGGAMLGAPGRGIRRSPAGPAGQQLQRAGSRRRRGPGRRARPACRHGRDPHLRSRQCPDPGACRKRG